MAPAEALPQKSRTGVQRMSGGRREGEGTAPWGARAAAGAGKISNSSKFCGAAREEEGVHKDKGRKEGISLERRGKTRRGQEADSRREERQEAEG